MKQKAILFWQVRNAGPRVFALTLVDVLTYYLDDSALA
jgi:hypothetical protein